MHHTYVDETSLNAQHEVAVHARLEYEEHRRLASPIQWVCTTALARVYRNIL